MCNPGIEAGVGGEVGGNNRTEGHGEESCMKERFGLGHKDGRSRDHERQ